MHGALSTNNHEAVRGAAVNGLGIGLLPEYQVVDDVLAGRLRRVLPNHTSEALPAYLVYPSRRHLPPRTRVVIDFLIDEVRRIRSRKTGVTPAPLVLLPGDGLMDGARIPFGTTGDLAHGNSPHGVQAKGRCEHRPHDPTQDLFA